MTELIRVSSPETQEQWEIPVLYADEHLLALDKPSGLLSSPGMEHPERPSLIKLLHVDIAEAKSWTTEHKLSYLMNAHRLDEETTGVLLLAKNKPALIALANLFGSDTPLLSYTALVRGTPPEDRFEVEAKLGLHPSVQGFTRVDPRRGKRARTIFSVTERFSRWTLLSCQPLPGRRHQIRAHLRSVALPIVGDALYGGKPLMLSSLKPNYRLKEGRQERPLLNRPALHAEHLTFPHPISGETVTITAPWPKDLKVAVKYLRIYGKESATDSITPQ